MLLSLKKIWSFLKNYWYIPVVLLGIIVVLVATQSKPDVLIEVLKKATENHNKEVDGMKKIHEEEIVKREKATEVYHETVKKVEEKYQEDKKKLSNKKKKEIKKLVMKNQENPEELARELAELTGFDFVGT